MSATQGYAAREGEVGAGFGFPLPQSVARSSRGHFVAQTQKLVVTWVAEAVLYAFALSGTRGSAIVTKEDVDAALGAVLNKMTHVQGRSRLKRLLRPDADISYRPPGGWSGDIVEYFEEQARDLISKWVAEVDRQVLLFPSMAENRVIDRALNATVLVTRRANGAKVAAAQQLAEPDVRQRLTPWPQVLLTGLGIRRAWNWLRTSVVRLLGAFLMMTGGAGGLWTLVEKELSAAKVDGLGPTSVAMVVVGLVVLVGGGRSGS